MEQEDNEELEKEKPVSPRMSLLFGPAVGSTLRPCAHGSTGTVTEKSVAFALSTQTQARARPAGGRGLAAPAADWTVFNVRILFFYMIFFSFWSYELYSKLYTEYIYFICFQS